MNSTSAKRKVFCYGTLRGTQLGKMLSMNDQITGMVVDLGRFPALVTFNTDLTVEGDVLEVDENTLAALDRYEGVDHGLYRRATTTTEAGHEVIVYMYDRIVRSWSADVQPVIEYWKDD